MLQAEAEVASQESSLQTKKAYSSVFVILTNV